MYKIYKLTSPSGRFYIGLTKTSLARRWSAHISRANTGINHGLYCAIRKYGAKSFTVEQIDTAPNKAAAQLLEMKHIAASHNRSLYNVSPGGEADGETGSKIFWDSINASPEKRAAYIEKLSQSKRANDHTDYEALAAAGKQWRKDNPREAYKLAYRGVRLAVKANEKIRGKPSPERQLTFKEHLMWKHRKPDVVRKNTTEFWRTITPEMRKHITDTNREISLTHWANCTDKEERSEKTRVARASIDRSIQGPAASKGVKNFWIELKKDPERYAAYMGARTKTLLETVARKKYENV